MLFFLRKKIENLLVKLPLTTTFIQMIRYYFGYVVYRIYKILKIEYIGGYLFSNQDNFRGRQEIIKMIFENCSKEKIKILEIGCYCGQTTLMIIKTLIKKNIDFEIYCVDTWSPFKVSKKKHNFYNTFFLKNLKNGKVFELFKYNLSCSKMLDNVKIIKGDSNDVLKKIEIKFDYIIIDGNHSYDYVKNDIYYSNKLINNNGYIIGDDYEASFAECKHLNFFNNFEEMAKSPEDTIYDEILKRQIHPGVTLAVYENYGNIRNKNGVFCVRFENNNFFDYFKS